MIVKECDIFVGREANLNRRFISDVLVLEDLYRELEHINRTNVPTFLNPKTATWIDVARHAKVRQNLK